MTDYPAGESLDAPVVSVWPDRIVYRASGLGGCPRALWAARKKYTRKPLPQNFQAIFARGHEIEDITKFILVNDGWTLINSQYEVRLDFPPMVELLPITVLGHIDCDSRLDQSDPYVLTEIKGFGKEFLSRYSHTDINAFPTYCAQISTYLHARHQSRWRFIVYQKTHTSPEDSRTRLIIREYEEPPWPVEKIRQRVEEIEFLATEQDPSKVPCINSYPCQYFYLHDTPQSASLTDFQVSTARAIKNLDAKIKLLTETRDRFRYKLQSQLESLPSTKFRQSNVSISIYTSPDRLDQQLAKKILEEAGVPKEEYIKKGSGKTMRITVKDRND